MGDTIISMPSVDDVIEWSKSSGLSQRDIARRSGVPLATVNRVLSGQTPSPSVETLLPIAKVVCPSSNSINDVLVCDRCRAIKILESSVMSKNRWLRFLSAVFIIENLALVTISLLPR